MQHNGVHDFHYVGGRYSGGQQPQSGTPEMLLWLGGIMLALDIVSALLVRADQLKRERAKAGTGDTLLP